MKITNFTKQKKLTLNQETLRSLTDSEVKLAKGGVYIGGANSTSCGLGCYVK